MVRWLAPVAAAVAVAGVIAGVAQTTHSPEKTVPRFTAPRPQPSAPDVMPPYYVVLEMSGSGPLTTTATVRDSQTGAVLSTTRLPNPQSSSPSLAISAAADGRTFLITDGDVLYLLRLASNGRSAQLTRLGLSLVPLRAHRAGQSFQFTTQETAALSPDGTMVAIAGQSSCAPVAFQPGADRSGCRKNTIRLVSLTNGAARTWTTQAYWQVGMWMSWDGNDHVLFSWANASLSGPQASGYRLLNIAGSGQNLLDSQTLPLPPLPSYGPITSSQSAFVTPDERQVVISTFTNVGSDGQKIMQVLELSASSGHPVRVLFQVNQGKTDSVVLAGDEGCNVLSLGPGGVHALIECTILTQTVFGRVDDGRFTSLPGMPFLGSTTQATAAW